MSQENNKPEPSSPAEAGAGNSIQQRLNALRDSSPETRPRTVVSLDEKTAGAEEMIQSLSTEKDEAFLKKFEDELFKRRRTANGAGTTDSTRKNGTHAPAISPAPAVASNGVGQGPKSLPPKGAILLLGGGDIAIFHRDVPSKQYQVVLVLNPDGTVSPEGLCLLQAYDFEKIGLIPVDQIDPIIHSLTWNRDHIIFHLDSFDYAHLIVRPRSSDGESRTATRTAEWPAPSKTAPLPTPIYRAEPAKLERGRRFQIPFAKDKSWEAVYWCEDAQGSVVAHKTQGVWSLMHLDLKRFKETMQIGEKVSDEEATEIEKALRRAWG